MKSIRILTFILTILGMEDALHGQTMDWSFKANPAFLSINSVAFRADGQKVLSGTDCHPAAIRIFDVASGDLNWDYTVGSAFLCIMGVTFSSNTSYIAAMEEFGNILLFDNTGQSPRIIDTIDTGTSYGFATAISPGNDKIAVACSNGKMKIYSIPGGDLVADVNAHPNWVTTVAYSPDGTRVVTGGNDGKVKIWSDAGDLIHTCTGHGGAITNVKVTPDNNFVVSSSKDDKLKVWNMSSGLIVQTFTGHTNDVNGLDISPDGSKVVSASADGTCRIWNFSDGSLFSKFGVVDSGAVNTVAWSPIGDKIVTGNKKSDIVLWSVPFVSSQHEPTDLSDFSFTLSPNPATQQIQINMPSLLSLQQIDITDMLGRVVFTSKPPVLSIDIGHLQAGIYFLTIHSKDHKTATKSFFKE